MRRASGFMHSAMQSVKEQDGDAYLEKKYGKPLNKTDLAAIKKAEEKRKRKAAKIKNLFGRLS